MWKIREIKRQALFRLNGFMWKGVLVFVINLVILNLLTYILPAPNIDSMINYPEQTMKIISDNLGQFMTMYMTMLLGSLIINIFVGSPLEVGIRRFFQEATEGNIKISNIFFAFKNNYINIVKVMFIRNIVIELWSLLLIFPGVVKSFQLYFIPMQLAQNPNLTYKEAAKESKQMTNGDKLHIFGLNLSFIGWMLLGMVFAGVGVLLVYPYMYETDEMLYRHKKTDNTKEETIPEY